MARRGAGPTLSFRRGNERVTELTKTRWRFSSRKRAAAEEAGVEAGGGALLRPQLLRAPPARGPSSGWLPAASRGPQIRRVARRRAEVLVRRPRARGGGGWAKRVRWPLGVVGVGTSPGEPAGDRSGDGVRWLTAFGGLVLGVFKTS